MKACMLCLRQLNQKMQITYKNPVSTNVCSIWLTEDCLIFKSWADEVAHQICVDKPATLLWRPVVLFTHFCGQLFHVLVLFDFSSEKLCQKDAQWAIHSALCFLATIFVSTIWRLFHRNDAFWSQGVEQGFQQIWRKGIPFDNSPAWFVGDEQTGPVTSQLRRNCSKYFEKKRRKRWLHMLKRFWEQNLWRNSKAKIAHLDALHSWKWEGTFWDVSSPNRFCITTNYTSPFK